MLVHTRERKHACEICGKTFTQKSHVKTHQSVHTGAKPFMCSVPGCNKSFSQLGHLNGHLDRHKKIDLAAGRTSNIHRINAADIKKGQFSKFSTVKTKQAAETKKEIPYMVDQRSVAVPSQVGTAPTEIMGTDAIIATILSASTAVAPAVKPEVVKPPQLSTFTQSSTSS